jgi:long-chain fatty acid transport protein
MRRRTWLIACSMFAVLWSTTGAHAQTSVQIPLQWDFVNPGAKSLAMAGAFTGLADDATAGYANPAGLRELGRTEVSIEARGRWLASSFLQRGRLSGPVQNEGTDVIAGPVFGESSDNSFRVPYVSVVFPRPQQGWAIAGFRHELSRVNQISFSEGVFQQDPAEITSRREFPQEGIRKITITSYGAAGAIELNRRLAVGATLNVHRLSLLGQYRRFDVDGFLGPPIRNVEFGRSTQEGKDTAFTPNIGIRLCLKPCDERQTASARLGFVYRRGATFTYETESGPNFRVNQFRVPDVFAGGIAFEAPRPGRRLLLTGEIKRATYSRLKDDFITDQAVDFGIENNLRIDDGTELRAGVQYTIETAAWLPRFRAGIWSDPDHSVKYLAGSSAQHPETRLKDEVLSVALSTGRRETHYTAGLGLTFSPTVEWNFGADFAANTTIVSTSVIVKLGR